MKGLEPRLLDQRPMEYRCYCSRERVSAALVGIGAEALSEMAAEGRSIEVGCQFCDAKYEFDPGELEEIRAGI